MLKESNLQRSLLRLSVLLAVVVVLIYIFGQWAESAVEAHFQAQEKQEAMVLAQAQINSVEKVMERGDASFTKAWLNRMNGVAGVSEISIHRRDGTLAFIDQKTIEQVNAYRGDPYFHRDSTDQSAKVHDDLDSVTLAGAGHEVTIHHGNGDVTLFMPIKSKASCLSCHGYDNDPVRGVYHVRLETWSSESRMAYLRDHSMIPAVSFILYWVLQV